MGCPLHRLAGRHAGFPPVRVVEPGRCGKTGTPARACPQGNGFDFACAGCGDCCRQRRDLVLSGFDPLPHCASAGAVAAHCGRGVLQKAILRESCLPALRLTPDPKTGNCRFFEGSACAIHAARPLACALIRWGRASTPKLQQSSIMSRPRCAAHGRGGAHPSGLSERCRCYRAGGHRRAVGCCVYPAFPTAAGGGRAGKSPPLRPLPDALSVRSTMSIHLGDEFYPQFCQNIEILQPLLDRML